MVPSVELLSLGFDSAELEVFHGFDFSDALVVTGAPAGSADVSLAAGSLLPGGMGFAWPRLEGVPDQVGTFPIVLKAALGEVEATRTFEISVEDTTPPAWATPEILPEKYVGGSLSELIQATDPSGPISYELMESDAGWVSLNTSTTRLTGNPTAPGEYGVRVRATDAYDNWSERTFQVVVAVDTEAPVWTTEPLLAAGTVGTSYSSPRVTATDNSGGAVTFSAPNGMPTGFSFTSSRISGVPTSAGSVEILLRATDPSGNYSDRTFVINVAAVSCLTGPVGTVCEDGAIYVGTSSGRVYVAPSDEPGTYQWSLTNTSTVSSSSISNGKTGTDAMVAKGGHPAAEACRARGEQWYLPARDEAALFANKGSMIGGFFPVGLLNRHQILGWNCRWGIILHGNLLCPSQWWV